MLICHSADSKPNRAFFRGRVATQFVLMLVPFVKSPYIKNWVLGLFQKMGVGLYQFLGIRFYQKLGISYRVGYIAGYSSPLEFIL